MSFLTDRTVGTVLTVNDKIHIVDVDDLTGSPLGTSKQYTLQQLKTIVDSDTQDLENVLTYGNSTGIHDISLSDGKTLKADNGSGFVNLRNAGIDSDVTVGNTNSNIFFDNDVGTYLNDGIIGVDDLAGVSLVRNDQISFNLTASDFSRIGSFALVVNDVSDYNILNVPNYCGYSSSEGGKIKLGVKNSWIVAGAGAIAKTNNTAYANQLGFNTGEAFETILNYTTATANNTVTIQDGSGTLAFLTDVSSMYGVNGALTSDREVTLTSAFGISFLGGQTTLKGSGATSATKSLLIKDSTDSSMLSISDNMTAIFGTFIGAKDNRTTFLINGNAVNSQSNSICFHAKANIDNCADSNIALFESSNTSGGTPSLTSNVLKVVSGWAATGSITGLVVGGHGFTGVGVDNDSLTQLKVNHIYDNYATPPYDTAGFEVTNNVSRVVAWGAPTRYKYGAKIISTGVWENSSVGGNDAVNIGLDVTVSGGELNYSALFNGGNVGIGTTTPTASLHIDGTMRAENLPVSSVGLVAGDIWNDSGTLKII